MTFTPQEQVKLFLADVAEERRCSVCRNEALAIAIRYFLDLKAKKEEGAEHVAFTWFYREKLQPEFGGPAERTARDHVRLCLRRDTETGEKL
jgi:hypothetical protein